MDRQPRRALITAGLCALAAAGRAQNPPTPTAPAPARLDTARVDTLTPQLLYDETFAAGSNIVPRVTLEA